MNKNNSEEKTALNNGKFFSNNIIISDVITTPYERVLSILREVKKYIFKVSKENILIKNLDWAIKIITSRSLYSYEIKEVDTVNQLSKENPEFKQLVDFVSEYNEKVIQMYQQYSDILTDKLLTKPSTKLNRQRIVRRASFAFNNNSHFINLLQKGDNSISKPKDSEKKVFSNKNNNLGISLDFKKRTNSNIINANTITVPNLIKNKSNNTNNNEFGSSILKKKSINKKSKKQIVNINDEEDESKNILEISGKYHKHQSEDDSLPIININKKNNNKHNLFPSVQKISITINNNNNENNINNQNKENGENIPQRTNKRRHTSINEENISLRNSIDVSKRYTDFNRNKKMLNIGKDYSFFKIKNKIIRDGYDSSKLINEKNFDAFKIKELIGYNYVLPFVGRMILENLGLIDEEILNIDKLDSFLFSVNSQYKEDTLYHNSLHGTDVTQSIYIFFSRSNAEKVAKTNVLDLLSIFIAALGHDIAHPGLTNTFHINDSTDIAIEYNDISVLENFHASTLFKTLRRTENNIFEKLTNIDYKIIRKRMISEILATDMANHGKVISLMKSKISTNEDGIIKLNLLSGNEQDKIEEQQILLNFFIHLADLAHNTRLFSISLKWVELLSEEFWRQGDKEKELNLPVTFLCDREKVNIPQSQKGFITGFIIPTFDCLVSIFPTLRFTLDNANTNLKEWQKLLNAGRAKGWTPPKKIDKKDNYTKVEPKKYQPSKSGKIISLKNKNKNNSNDKKKINSNIGNNKTVNYKSNSNINKNRKLTNNIHINKSKISKKKLVNSTNIEISKKEIPNKNERFNTPIKLRKNTDFFLSNEKKYPEFLLLSYKKENVPNESVFKKNLNKVIYKNNVNKTKK